MNIPAEYVPSRQHQISGTSLRHDPNIQSSTIENLDDDDDDEDVYDPNKPTLFQKIQNTEQSSATTTIPANTNQPAPIHRDEGISSLEIQSDLIDLYFQSQQMHQKMISIAQRSFEMFFIKKTKWTQFLH